MTISSPADLTLRQHVLAALRLNQELAAHVDQALVPKSHLLRQMTRDGASPSPDDKTVHAAAAAVLEADHLAVSMYERFKVHCEAIRRSIDPTL